MVPCFGLASALEALHQPALALPLLFLAAAAAGFMNAVAGGGTFLSFPALTAFGGLTEKAANMTSTLGIWPGSATAIYAAKSEFRLIPRSMILTFGLISLIGGTLGSLLLILTPSKTFLYVIPWLLAFATVIFACSKPIARWAGRKHGHRALKWTLFVAAVQFFVAIYGGYFGAGAGVLMLAGLAFAGLDSLHQTNALKVFLGTVINGVSILVFAAVSLAHSDPAGSIRWTFALTMALASALGGYTGMHFARRIQPDSLRAIVLLVGVLLTLAYAYKAYFA